MLSTPVSQEELFNKIVEFHSPLNYCKNLGITICEDLSKEFAEKNRSNPFFVYLSVVKSSFFF